MLRISAEVRSQAHPQSRDGPCTGKQGSIPISSANYFALANVPAKAAPERWSWRNTLVEFNWAAACERLKLTACRNCAPFLISLKKMSLPDSFCLLDMVHNCIIPYKHTHHLSYQGGSGSELREKREWGGGGNCSKALSWCLVRGRVSSRSGAQIQVQVSLYAVAYSCLMRGPALDVEPSSVFTHHSHWSL